MKNLKINNESKVLKGAAKVVRNAVIGTMVLVTPILSSCTKDTNTTESSSYVVNIDEIKEADDSVSLFNVGNYEIKGESNLRDIKKANKKGVPCGFIINTIASSRADIYNDVEYVKYLIERSDINCPVYLNIDSLIKNSMLRIDEMLDLISTFASKLTENKIFVGICGKESNIKKFVENDTNNILKAYDVFLIDNDENLDVESSVSSMIKVNEDGSYVTYNNFEKICDKKNLNNVDNFLYDRVHEVKDNETIADIAFSYGLSVNDLLEYNECTAKKMPKFLRIPSVSQSKIFSSNSERKLDGEYAFGLDISGHQSDVDWDLIEDRYDFMLLKATSHVDIANKFEEFSSECSLRDIPYGVYFANYVSCKNDYGKERSISEMKRLQLGQIEAALKAMADKNIALPAYFDFEDFEGNFNLAKNYTDEQCVVTLDLWYDRLTAAGYVPGIYCGKENLLKLKNAYDKKYGSGELEKKFKIWVSGDIVNDYYYNSKINYNAAKTQYSKLNDNTFNVEGVSAGIIQPNQYGKEFGAKNGYGYADHDFAKSEEIFPDYAVKDSEDSKNSNYNQDLVATKKPNQKSAFMHELGLELNESYLVGFATGGLVVISGALAAGLLIEKKKKSKQYVK